MVIWTGFSYPSISPDHFSKSYSFSGTAVISNIVPLLYFSAFWIWLSIFIITVPSPSISIVNAYCFFTNTAVTVFALSMVICLGLSVPVKSPVHSTNSHSADGVAVSSTIVPLL